MDIQITTSGWTQAQAYFDQMNDRLRNDQSRGLFKSLNGVGDIFKDNFDSEGRRVGGWAELAELTQAKRESFGMPPDHPIMFRDGALRDVVAVYLSTANAPGSKSTNDSYSGHATQSSISVSDGKLTVDATGWKVSNQYDISGVGGHVARPFWFVDDSVMFAANSGLIDWLVNDVLGQGV